MVDVSAKPWTDRLALARCRVVVPGLTGAGVPAPAWAPDDEAPTWPELLATARIAGIQAAKRTSTLIPLCHQLTSARVEVVLALADGCVEIEGTAQVVGPTGVEMEALTACAAAALTIVAATQPGDPDVVIEDLTLWHKSGGRSGNWVRAEHPA
jgi:cyclic pyranopterin phosphate synthase